MKKFKILNSNAFCLFEKETLGIAGSTFAASGWRISDEIYNNVRGQKFGWIASNGDYYTNLREYFSRPTEDQIQTLMTESLLDQAVEQKIVEII